MLSPSDETTREIGNAVFEKIKEMRGRPHRKLKFQGQSLLLEPPIFVDIACLLQSGFCKSNIWKNDPSIIALVEQTIEDLHREEQAQNDEEYIQTLQTIRNDLISWLQE